MFVKIKPSDARVGDKVRLVEGSKTIIGIVGEIGSSNLFIFQDTHDGSKGEIKPETLGKKYAWAVGLTSAFKIEREVIEVKPVKKVKTPAYKKFLADINMDIDPENYQVLEYCVRKNKPLLIVAETGCGKTSLIQNYGKLLGNVVRRINLNGQTSSEEILGRWLLKGGETVWQDGILVEAMKRGEWIVFDEINAALPEIIFTLHSLLDHDQSVTLVEKDNETVRPVSGFRFFATMNPDERYAGTKILNTAFKSRFPAIMTMNYAENEEGIITMRTGCTEETAKRLVLIAKEVRNMYFSETINYPCSTRDLLYTADLSKNLEFVTAIKVGIINKADESEREALAKAVSLLISEEIVVTAQDSFKSINDLINGFKELKKEKDEVKQKMTEMNTHISKLDKEVSDKDNQIGKLTNQNNDYKELIDKKDGVIREEITKMVMAKLKTAKAVKK